MALVIIERKKDGKGRASKKDVHVDSGRAGQRRKREKKNERISPQERCSAAGSREEYNKDNDGC